MKETKDKKRYEFKTLESYPPKEKYCHYSRLPSPSAYALGDIYVKPKKSKKEKHQKSH